MPDYHDRILLIGGAIIAAAAALIAIRAVRSTEPTVIGISRKGVLVDHPQWLLRRRRHFRHWELVTLQPVSDEKRDRDGRKTGVVEHALEVRFLYGPSLWLLQGADMAEVRSASDPLREALGLDPRPAASSTSQT